MDSLWVSKAKVIGDVADLDGDVPSAWLVSCHSLCSFCHPLPLKDCEKKYGSGLQIGAMIMHNMQILRHVTSKATSYLSDHLRAACSWNTWFDTVGSNLLVVECFSRAGLHPLRTPPPVYLHLWCVCVGMTTGCSHTTSKLLLNAYYLFSSLNPVCVDFDYVPCCLGHHTLLSVDLWWLKWLRVRWGQTWLQYISFMSKWLTVCLLQRSESSFMQNLKKNVCHVTIFLSFTIWNIILHYDLYVDTRYF